MPVGLTTLHWGSRGAGRRALLVHGLGASAATWWRIADELGEAGYHVTAPDLRGHGGSPRTVEYGFAAMAADLGELGGGWDLVVGHSLGGLVAAAAQHQANRLVLIDPVFDIPEADFPALAEAQVSQPDETIERVRAANPRWHPEDVRLAVEASRTAGRYVVDRVMRDNAPWHFAEVAARLRVPTTVLGADPAVGTTFDPAVTAANPLITVHVIGGTGHSVHRDDPEAVLSHLLD